MVTGCNMTTYKSLSISLMNKIRLDLHSLELKLKNKLTELTNDLYFSYVKVINSLRSRR